MVAALEVMSEDEVLDFAGACAETARRADVDLLHAAYRWAVLHSADRLDPVEAARPGREVGRQLGGPGTPPVTEFAAAELGARIGRSPYAAARLIGDALDLHHRHPQLWARVQAGEVRASYARHVVTRTRDLEPAEAAYVDAGVVESADGRICWSRFEALVEAKVAQAAPALAREREERAAKARFAKKLPGAAHGMATFMVRADIATIEAIAAAVKARADRLAGQFPEAPDLQSDDERRVHAVLLLATGAEPAADPADLLPEVQLFVHLYRGPDREAIARVEGHGPVTDEWVREVLGPRARFTIRPVLDLAGQAPVDSYEIPERHRRAVHLMTPADTFPYASCTSRAHADRPHHPPRGRRPLWGGQLRPDGHRPSPDQDPRAMAGPTTLPRHLPMARPPRHPLPRRPHRHPPPTPPSPGTAGPPATRGPRAVALASPADLRPRSLTNPPPARPPDTAPSAVVRRPIRSAAHAQPSSRRRASDNPIACPISWTSTARTRPGTSSTLAHTATIGIR